MNDTALIPSQAPTDAALIDLGSQAGPSRPPAAYRKDAPGSSPLRVSRWPT